MPVVKREKESLEGQNQIDSAQLFLVLLKITENP
jgi:hypothetical protein